MTVEPHQTTLESSSSANSSERDAPFYSDLTFAGPLDAIRASGFVTTQDGDALPLRYYDPASSTTSDLTAVGINTSDPSHVSVYNTLSTAYTVTPLLTEVASITPRSVSAKAVIVPAHRAVSLNLQGAVADLARQGTKQITLTLHTDAPIGGLIGAVSEENSEALAIEDIPLRTSNPPVFMRGFYPLRWTSDYINRPMVTNASSKPETVLAYVIAGDITYNFPPIVIPSLATHFFDVDSIRTDGRKDFLGKAIPKTAIAGKFQWTGTPENQEVGLIGKMEVISREKQRASSFSCSAVCLQSLDFPNFSQTPWGTVYLSQTQQFTASRNVQDAYGNHTYSPMSAASSGLASSSPSVLAMTGDPSAMVINLTGESYGNSQMSYIETYQTYRYSVSSCIPGPQTKNPHSGTGTVPTCPSSVTLNSVAPVSITVDPNLHTGYGAMTSMMTNPTSQDWSNAIITESVTPVSSNCPSAIGSGVDPRNEANGLSFHVSQGASLSDDPSVNYMPIHDAFYDEHNFLSPSNALTYSSAFYNNPCTVVLSQTYSCGGSPIGTFKITKTFTLGNANGGSAAIVSIAKQ